MFTPGERVVLTLDAKQAISAKYGVTTTDHPSLNSVGVVIANPYVGIFPQELIDRATEASGLGETWVRWAHDPDTPTPMANHELTLWAPSGEQHPYGTFKVGDTVMTRAEFCPCERCSFTAGRVIEVQPSHRTVTGESGDYTVQWDDGWVTIDEERELCYVGDRYN